MRNRIFLLVVIMAFLFSGVRVNAQEGPINYKIEAVTEITPVMGYQGRLVEAGVPVTGTRTMTFSLFNVQTGGTQIWSETKDVIVSNGLFQTALGDTIPFTQTVRVDMLQDLWLQVSVGGVVLPRQQLMGAPFAFTLAPGAVIKGNRYSDLLTVINDADYGLALSVEGNQGIYSRATGAEEVGVTGFSDTGRGVYAVNHGSGLKNPALTAHAYNPAGIALLAESESTDSAIVSGNNGIGPLFKAFGGNGGEHEFIVLNDGTVQQAPTADGLVKSAVYAQCAALPLSITREFNNVSGVTTIGLSPVPNSCILDFGFDIGDRFWTTNGKWDCYQYDTTKLLCRLGEDPLMLVVY